MYIAMIWKASKANSGSVIFNIKINYSKLFGITERCFPGKAIGTLLLQIYRGPQGRCVVSPHRLFMSC